MHKRNPFGAILSLFAASCHHMDVASKVVVTVFEPYSGFSAYWITLGVINALLAIGYFTFGWHVIGILSKLMIVSGKFMHNTQIRIETKLVELIRSLISSMIRFLRWIARWFK